MYRLRQFIVLIGDIVSLYLGLYLALIVRTQTIPTQNLNGLLCPMTGLFILAVMINFIIGLYDLTKTKNNWQLFGQIIISLVTWTILGVLYFYIQPQHLITPKTILLLTSLFGFGLIAGWRYFHNKFISKIIFKIKVVFVGDTPETKELMDKIHATSQLGYEIIGLVNNSQELAPLKNSPQLLVIAPHLAKDEQLLKELYGYLSKQIEMMDLAKFYEEIMGRIPPFTFSESWFLTNLHEQQKRIYDRARIIVDLIFGFLLGLFFLITFPFLALIIKFSSPGPIFFSQERVGRGGKFFKIYKYRTMIKLSADGSAEIGGPQFAQIKDTRVTPIGKILRRARLDEIPQFINILKGEMSIIGPRPERPEFVKQLTETMPFYTLRHLVKPGLTGWAQLHESYYGTISENLRKLEYDLYYIKNRGWLLDMTILFKTVNVLIRLMGR